MIPAWTTDKEPHIRTSETNHWYRMVRNGEITEIEFFDALNDAIERAAHAAHAQGRSEGAVVVEAAKAWRKSFGDSRMEIGQRLDTTWQKFDQDLFDAVDALAALGGQK